jgi:hypothetical protein
MCIHLVHVNSHFWTNNVTSMSPLPHSDELTIALSRIHMHGTAKTESQICSCTIPPSINDISCFCILEVRYVQNNLSKYRVALKWDWCLTSPTVFHFKLECINHIPIDLSQCYSRESKAAQGYDG